VTRCLRDETEIGAGSALGAYIGKAAGWNRVFTQSELFSWLLLDFAQKLGANCGKSS
jgi:hypothetical protein